VLLHDVEERIHGSEFYKNRKWKRGPQWRGPRSMKVAGVRYMNWTSRIWNLSSGLTPL